MTYTTKEYDMILADTNAMNHIILRRHDDNAYITADWDLSDEEIEAIKKRFEREGLTDDDMQSEEWFYSLDEYNGFEYIA